ncbi:major tail protein [Numidum massiliense]|uniref:major tail protein n=1 Tax=Numidum massiliense TaxID=1522315 RepID=UPI0006D54783|nr:major tail protein [Numidum massiliense]
MASSIVGLENIVYAKLISDTQDAVEYGEVKPFAPAITASVETAQDSATQYADNGPIAVATQIGETTLNLTVNEIPQEVLADILGQEMVKGVIAYKQDIQAPYLALGFTGNKENGKKRLVWLTKGRFTIPSDEWNTKQDSPEFQNAEIQGTFIRRDFDKVFKIVADTEVEEFTYEDEFFTEVFDLSKLTGGGGGGVEG